MNDELITKIKNHDVKAFETLVTLYEKKVYNYAYGFTLNREDALDITQEVFLKVYKNIQKFKEESSISTWIYKITSNVCIDFARKSKPGNIININDENFNLIENIKDSAIAPVDFVLQNELSEEIIDSLNKLDFSSRQIVVMRDILQLSYSEIATILNLEDGTVKSKISRSRKKLRDIIVKSRNIFENPTSK